MKALVAPTMVPAATINHPFGNPKIKPARVTEVEYPTIGGKAVMKQKTNIGIHPALELLQQAVS
jgi:hypothetical protein